jgi:hypothetical protein
MIYLNEKGESDPLVVLGILLVFGQIVLGVVYAGEGHIYAHLLEERPGYRVRGVNPTKCVQ